MQEIISTKKQARYGPLDRYGPPPPAGMCISVFAVVRREGKKGVLLGLPKPSDEWPEDWLSSLLRYTEKERAEIYDKWRLPSCYLREGEHPKDAVHRILGEQIKLGRFKVSVNPRVYSYTAKSDWYPGNSHWDLGFVYDVKTGLGRPPQNQKLWRELRYFEKKKEVEELDFGWNSDFMLDLKLL